MVDNYNHIVTKGAEPMMEMVLPFYCMNTHVYLLIWNPIPDDKKSLSLLLCK